MIAQSQNQSVATGVRSKTGWRASWQWQLLKTDFRHALWPWAGYLVVLFVLFSSVSSAMMNGLLFILPALIAATVVQVVCSDFSHGTLASLLCAPVIRWQILSLRYGMLFVMLLLPLIAALFALPGEAGIIAPVIIIAIPTVAAAVPIALFLKKKPVAWSGIVATAVFLYFGLIVASNIMYNLFGLAGAPPVTRGRFDDALFVIYLSAITIGATVLSFWYWRRMEVRS